MRRLLALSLVAAAIAGCGGGDAGSEEPANTPQKSSGEDSGGKTTTASAGKELFTAKCGSCHTLADAGTEGTFGPNLDELKPDEQTVRTQIEHGGGGMPANLYEGEEADAVASYV